MAEPEEVLDRGLTLATSGHIDHGKTRLVGALTGVDTDRLEEERRRGISIELGFAKITLPGGKNLGVVDVPGHERLVCTMVAGASGVDLFLLVVAADDGVMPQTIEHVQILEALGVAEGVVAVSKVDMATPGARRRARAQVRQLLPDTPIVEVSAQSGRGLAKLRDELAKAAERLGPPPQRTWPPDDGLLHVDRSFTITGAGTVVTGTVTGGRFVVGERVRILPGGREVRLRAIQLHGSPRNAVAAGHRAALNLASVDRAEVPPGSVVSGGEFDPLPSWRLDVRLRHAFSSHEAVPRRLQVHHGTRDVPARHVPLEGGFAQLRLEAQLIPTVGDRVVLRSISPPGTIGGAEVVDPAPRRHRGGPALDALRILCEGSPCEVLGAALRTGQTVDGDPARWRADRRIAFALRRFGEDQWRGALARLDDAGTAEGAPARSTARLDTANRAPRSLGSLEQLALGLLRRDGSEPRSPAALADELGCAEPEVTAALDQLVSADLAIRLGRNLYYEKSELARIQQALVEIVRRRGAITIAELRDALGTSRKYAQAMLDYTDRIGVTVRHGDERVSRRRSRL